MRLNKQKRRVLAPLEGSDMFHRRGKAVSMKWSLIRKRTLSRLARTSGIMSLAALLLFRYSATEDFHFRTLHGSSLPAWPLQVLPTTTNSDQMEDWAYPRQLVADASSAVKSFQTASQSFHSLPETQKNPILLHIHTTWQDRAPPSFFCPF